MIKHWYIAALIILLAFTCKAHAKHLHLEKYYQDLHCSANNGQQEIVLNTRLRADCITKKEAIEYDFANKYRESLIQALEYADATGKQAKSVLIVENPSELEFINSAMHIIKTYNLPIIIEVYKAY